MASDGSLVLHIHADSISPVLCIVSQNRLLGTSAPIGVHWWSRSSLCQALAVTLEPSHQSYIMQKKPHDASHLVPINKVDKKGDEKRACNTAIGNRKWSGANPKLPNHCCGRHACRVPKGAQWPKTHWRQKEQKESLQHHDNHIHKKRNGNYI